MYKVDYELLAEKLLDKNYSHDDIIDVLVQRGLERYSAEDLLADVLAGQGRQHFWRGVMVVTGGLILLGVMVLIINAIQRGDSLSLSYAVIPFIFGLSMVAHALRNWSN